MSKDLVMIPYADGAKLNQQPEPRQNDRVARVRARMAQAGDEENAVYRGAVQLANTCSLAVRAYFPPGRPPSIQRKKACVAVLEG